LYKDNLEPMSLSQLDSSLTRHHEVASHVPVTPILRDCDDHEDHDAHPWNNEDLYPNTQFLCGGYIPRLSTQDITKLREIHAWLSEIMPALREAATMFENRGGLAKRWLR